MYCSRHGPEVLGGYQVFLPDKAEPRGWGRCDADRGERFSLEQPVFLQIYGSAPYTLRLQRRRKHR